MSYSVKSVVSFRGTDGYGFNAVLCRDGVNVAFVIDEGGGGCLSFQWYDQIGPRVTVPWTDYQNKPFEIRCTVEEAKLYEEIRGKMWTGPKELGGQKVSYNSDSFVCELVDEFENAKRLKRFCKTKILFRLKGDDEGEWQSFKALYSQEWKDALVKRFGDQLESILNETHGQVS